MAIPESVLGYCFRDPRLLIEALTHGSVGYETQQRLQDNQRLEFLGDAVLQLTLSEMLYTKLRHADEGVLTKTRAQLVSSKALAQLGRKLHLGGYLIMGKGEEAHGGRQRESALADAVEAIAGAIFLDGGMSAAQAFARFHFESLLAELIAQPVDLNPKGQLQELIQSLGTQPPHYRMIHSDGPDHSKTFVCAVLWQGATLATGKGKSKKEAETDAARAALSDPELPTTLKKLVEANFTATEIPAKSCEQAANKPPHP